MMNLLIAQIFFRNAVFRLRSVWLLMFAALDLVIVLSAVGRSNVEDAFNEITRNVLLGFILPITAMLLGTAIVREEVERGTLGYWLARPISRTRFLVVRFLCAAATVAVASSAIFAINLFLLPASAVSGARGFVGVILGSLAYTAFFSALGVWLKRPFIVGAILVLLIDFPVSQLPMSARYLTIRAHVENVTNLMMELPEMMQRLFDPVDPAVSVATLVGLGIVGAWLTSVAFRRLEFVGADG